MKKFCTILIIFSIFGLAVHIHATEQNVVLEIEGMSCKLCPLAIKKSLLQVEGVRDVKVSFEDKKAWLMVEESVSDEILIKAVENAGPYKGKVLERRAEE